MWNEGDVLMYESERGVVVEVDNTYFTANKRQMLLVEFQDGRREFIANTNVETP